MHIQDKAAVPSQDMTMSFLVKHLTSTCPR